MALPELADVVILAERTFHVAVREKDRATATLAAERRFFAVMRAIARHDRQHPRAADAALGVAINVTFLRAQVARGKMQEGMFHTARQFAVAEELEIGWLKRGHFFALPIAASIPQ
jgi:hypothetical protein